MRGSQGRGKTDRISFPSHPLTPCSRATISTKVGQQTRGTRSREGSIYMTSQTAIDDDDAMTTVLTLYSNDNKHPRFPHPLGADVQAGMHVLCDD